MIQANEIRIGNKIFLSTKQEVFEVVSMTKNTISSDSYCREHSEFEGIPLTEEILLKCGFEKYSSSQYRKNGVDLWQIERGSNKDEFLCNNITNIGGLYLKYLHQLQNLYFALTGKELEINL